MDIEEDSKIIILSSQFIKFGSGVFFVVVVVFLYFQVCVPALSKLFRAAFMSGSLQLSGSAEN